jgi:hypothetical protein
MLRLAGRTEADLGYRHNPRKPPLPEHERVSNL